MSSRSFGQCSSSHTNTSQFHYFKYDVFVSFRGPDTRENFIRPLVDQLRAQGVVAFLDEDDLEKGERIDALFDAIHCSYMFVIVMSENYGESKWCMKELREIVQTRRTFIPVFYDVDPNHVQHQSGEFGRAFQEGKAIREDESIILEFRKALQEVGETSGFVLKGRNNHSNLASFMELIVKNVTIKVKVPLDVSKHPIAIDLHVQEVKKSIPPGRENLVLVLSIVGIGGVGKTTLAKAFYNSIMLDFDICCFLDNVREMASNSQIGLLGLQKRLVDGIWKMDRAPPRIWSVPNGKSTIERIVRQEKVLLILDDVDHIDQIDAIAEKKNWFGKGSLIIITSRDRSITMKHYQEECPMYELKCLSHDHSVQLFSLHAFLDDKPPPEFKELSHEFVKSAGGLPLALQVYGKELFSKKSKKYWLQLLEKLKEIPHDDVLKKLKLSYDSLGKAEKQVFLDIACFFVGKEIDYASYMWDSCGFLSEVAVQLLVERSLVSIRTHKSTPSRMKDEVVRDADGLHTFEMHDQIRDMALYVISQEGGRMPTRIWKEEDVAAVSRGRKTVALKAVASFSNVYGYAKENSGPLKSGVESVEGTVKTMIQPVYDRYRTVPYQLLHFVDQKVDETVTKVNNRVPSQVKEASTQVYRTAQLAPVLARSVASDVKQNGVTKTVKSRCEPVIAKYEPVAEQYAVMAWHSLNRLPLFPQVAQVILPSAAYCSGKYNEAVAHGAERGFFAAAYLPLVPTERIAKVFAADDELQK